MAPIGIVDEARMEWARADALVKDESGREYVAIHPGYACKSQGKYRRVLASRIVLCVVIAITETMVIVGQVLPYVHNVLDTEFSDSEETWPLSLSVWSGWFTAESLSVHFTYAQQNVPAEVVVTIASVLTVLCVVMTAVYAALRSYNESARGVDATSNLHVLAEYGRARPGEAKQPSNPFSYVNRRVENNRLVANVPLEQRELRRRKVDRLIGIIIFSLLLVAAALVLVTVALLSHKFTSEYARYSGKLDAGFIILTLLLLMYIVSLVLLAVPHASNLHLCRLSPPTRCVLMVAHEGDEMNDMPPVAWLRQHPEHHYDSAITGPNVFVPGVAQGIPMALPAPPVDTLRATPSVSDATHPSSSQRNGAPPPEGGYQSSTYYNPPPQLFNVRSDAVAAAAACSGARRVKTVD